MKTKENEREIQYLNKEIARLEKRIDELYQLVIKILQNIKNNRPYCILTGDLQS